MERRDRAGVMVCACSPDIEISITSAKNRDPRTPTRAVAPDSQLDALDSPYGPSPKILFSFSGLNIWTGNVEARTRVLK